MKDHEINSDTEELRQAAYERGSWNENPEEDGYWISPDGRIIEIFYNWDLDDAEHHDWIRAARNITSKDMNENKDRKK